jgi:antitoxin VapB
MGIFIKDPRTEEAIRKLAEIRGTTLTEAVRSAVLQELAAAKPQDEDALLAELHHKVEALPDTGLKADKEFYDGLYED